MADYTNDVKPLDLMQVFYSDAAAGMPDTDDKKAVAIHMIRNVQNVLVKLNAALEKVLVSLQNATHDISVSMWERPETDDEMENDFGFSGINLSSKLGHLYGTLKITVTPLENDSIEFGVSQSLPHDVGDGASNEQVYQRLGYVFLSMVCHEMVREGADCTRIASDSATSRIITPPNVDEVIDELVAQWVTDCSSLSLPDNDAALMP
ncbi:hypothetical protein ACFOY8_14010 [Thalassospira xianhensis]|uniref:Uncharacterized protein n=1 Tax=Thalassospira xianhensis MCCC 1A02616 TaxID=1177929 RepID=A0A367UK66_9PROT|nr:hypothetical protein [Thalassospira xianhensis]RCK07724.1 hypothetical protein TH5_01260 [Thalassospira xianhensis MCCC 1A02616]